MHDDSAPEPVGEPEADLDAAGGGHQGSLTDDIGALFDDGKTYVEAELNYQKTRLAFVADRGKSGTAYILGALGFIHLALIGLVMGAIQILVPLIGAALATLSVVGVLLVGAVVLAFAAKTRFGKIGEAFKGGD